MRIAKLNMDAQDKTRFEIQGKSSVKYHLKANHVVEAKRWFWALNNAIQWAKDEAKEDDKRRTKDAEVLRQAKIDQVEKHGLESQTDSASLASGKGNNRTLAPPSSLGVQTPSGSKLSLQISRGGTDSGVGDDDTSITGAYDPNSQPDMNRIISHVTTTADAEGDEDEYGDYTSSQEARSSSKDAFSITAQSVKLQLDLLSNVSSALQTETSKTPTPSLSDPSVSEALTAYERAISSLNSLVVDLLKISTDRDAYWQYRLDREADARKMWEESMTRVAKEQEELQNKMGECEDKRKRTKKALKEALENQSATTSRPLSQRPSQVQISDAVDVVKEIEADKQSLTSKPSDKDLSRRKSVLLSESESDEEDEFFDAIEAGELEILVPPKEELPEKESDARTIKQSEIVPSFKGYEDSIRQRLKMDADDRPKISLWVSTSHIT